VDLYLLHQPMPTEFEATVGAYKALEKVLADGRARAIGVCNHKPHHLENLIGRTDVIPAVNQVELHPYFTQPDVQEAHGRHGIVTQAWSPIGGVTVYRPADPSAPTSPLKNPTIVELGWPR
jgi:diketogulonate reductase-like aldo/keto reductase